METRKVPTAPSGKVFVKISKRFNDEIVTESGIRLFVDTTWRPEWNTVIHGEVVSIPHKLGRQFENVGICPEVQVGDKIYFSWMVTLKKDRLFEVEEEDGSYSQYWVVDYFHIWCVVRNEQVIMIGGKVLVEPITEVKEEKYGSIIIPDAYRKEKLLMKGILRHIGEPVEGSPYLDVEPGDVVYFPKNCAFVNEVEGVEYYLFDQYYLDAKEDQCREEQQLCV
jgi:co-chaperonin GroES (HSP10)